jgi:nuclear GTP-binding protein
MLQQLAKKKAALRIGGKANIEDAARTVLRDFLNGKIKYFTPPPVTAFGSKESDEEMS